MLANVSVSNKEVGDWHRCVQKEQALFNSKHLKKCTALDSFTMIVHKARLCCDDIEAKGLDLQRNWIRIRWELGRRQFDGTSMLVVMRVKVSIILTMPNGDVCGRVAGAAPPARPAAPYPRTPALAQRASASHNTLLSLMWFSWQLILYICISWNINKLCHVVILTYVSECSFQSGHFGIEKDCYLNFINVKSK